MLFKVFVDDNSHYQDESERYEQGEYDSYEAAVAVCRRIVDEYLNAGFKEGMDATELYNSYLAFGADPFVVPGPDGAGFSAWEYAKQRCNELCRATELHN